MRLLVARVSRWLVRARWRKAQFCALSVIKLGNKILFRRELIVRLQKNWRALLVRRHFHFRLGAIKAASAIDANLAEFEQIIAKQLKQSPERLYLEQESRLLRVEVDEFSSEIKRSIAHMLEQERDKLQSNQQVTSGENSKAACEQRLELLRTKRDLLVRSIRDKIARQQKELAELERQLSRERAQREADERARSQEEQLKRQRAELELRRQAEAKLELERNPPTRTERKLVDSATDPISLNYQLSQREAQELEQEQRDYEIALRLAQERDDSDSLKQSAPAASRVLAPSENLAGATQLKSGLNLTKWKYSDLRDTINTSCDLELLEACKREFHRRLKVYHAWRALNSSQGSSATGAGGLLSSQRAPSCIMNQSAGACNELTLAAAQSNANQSEQRYFRIPFLKPQQLQTPNGNSSTTSGQRGWWFAHFDGQWIARQLELHPNREPILLVAGEHDIDMCELSLAETRLTSKRGAEILGQEFEAEWQKHGGRPYSKRRVGPA